jgi:hypothetical protein
MIWATKSSTKDIVVLAWGACEVSVADLLIVTSTARAFVRRLPVTCLTGWLGVRFRHSRRLSNLSLDPLYVLSFELVRHWAKYRVGFEIRQVGIYGLDDMLDSGFNTHWLARVESDFSSSKSSAFKTGSALRICIRITSNVGKTAVLPVGGA